METKRITDLTILESLSDAANVLVEENGEAKRVPANKLGGSGGGVSSWNDLTDKPFGEELVMGDTLTWDGDITGRTYVDYDGMYMVHVSDVVPALDDFANGGSYVVSTNGSPASIAFASAEVIDMGGGAYGHPDLVFAVIPEDNVSIGEMLFPVKGVYFYYALPENMDMRTSALTINGYAGFEMVGTKTIEEKYLPGAAVLHVDSEGYLYASPNTDDTSKRMTRADLMALAGKPTFIYSTASPTSTMQVLAITDWVTYGAATVCYGSTIKAYCTAEYTPETT